MDIKQAFTELGLTPQASPVEAKSTYRTLAMRWHPDVNAGLGTESRMQRINVACALVCQHLDAQPDASHTAVKTDSRFSEFNWQTGFQPAGSGPVKPRGKCVQRTLRVSLFEAACGCIKRVHGMVADSCSRCAGTGEAPGTWTVGSKCLKCFGCGIVKLNGRVESRGTCDVCKGSGVYKPVPLECETCKGSGKAERRAWMLDVPIYAGGLDGLVVEPRDIRVRSGVQSLPGSFELKVHVEKHPLFKLDQGRLSVTVPISLWRWALGGEITVPTLDGSARVSLPTRPSALLVKDQGWPEYKSPKQRKPLYALPKIIYPEQLRHEERRMLELMDVRHQLPEVQGWSCNVQAWAESSEQDLG